MYKKKSNNTAFFCLLAMSSTLFSQYSFAGNTAVNDSSAYAQTMQAFTGVGDDPAAIYYNPAGIVQLPENQLEANLMYFKPDISYTNSINQASSSSTNGQFGPSTFVTSGKLAPWFFGIGVYSPFGRSINYEATSAVYNQTHSSTLLRVDFVPTIARKIGDYLSVGVSLVGSRIDAAANVLGLDQNVHGFGGTAQIGAMLFLPENVRIGLDYRGPENANLTGHGTLSPTPVGPISGGMEARFHFPGTLSSGISWQALPSFLVSLDYDYEMWSYLKNISPVYSNNLLTTIANTPINAHNSSDFRLGMRYSINTSNELRAGASYVERAIPSQNIIPAQPDYDASYLSAGYSHYFKQIRVDAGYEYIFASPVHTNNNAYFPGSFPGHLNVVMLGLNYIFA